MPAKIPEAKKYEIRRSGLNAKDASERFNISERAAANIIYGDMRNGAPRLRKMSAEFIKSVGLADGTTEELAKRFGVCVQSIRRAKATWRGPDRIEVAVCEPRLRPVFYRPFQDGTYS